MRPTDATPEGAPPGELSEADWRAWLVRAQPHIDRFTLDASDPGGELALVVVDADLVASSAPALAAQTEAGAPWVGWLPPCELGALAAELLGPAEHARLVQHLRAPRPEGQRLLVAVQPAGFGIFTATPAP